MNNSIQSDQDLRMYCAELVCKSNITQTTAETINPDTGIGYQVSLAREAELLYKFIKGEATPPSLIEW